MKLINLLLLLAAFACFVVAAFFKGSSRVNLVAAGLAAWVAVPLIAQLQLMDD